MHPLNLIIFGREPSPWTTSVLNMLEYSIRGVFNKWGNTVFIIFNDVKHVQWCTIEPFLSISRPNRRVKLMNDSLRQRLKESFSTLTPA